MALSHPAWTCELRRSHGLVCASTGRGSACDPWFNAADAARVVLRALERFPQGWVCSRPRRNAKHTHHEQQRGRRPRRPVPLAAGHGATEAGRDVSVVDALRGEQGLAEAHARWGCRRNEVDERQAGGWVMGSRKRCGPSHRFCRRGEAGDCLQGREASDRLAGRHRSRGKDVWTGRCEQQLPRGSLCVHGCAPQRSADQELLCDPAFALERTSEGSWGRPARWDDGAAVCVTSLASSDRVLCGQKLVLHGVALRARQQVARRNYPWATCSYHRHTAGPMSNENYVPAVGTG